MILGSCLKEKGEESWIFDFQEDQEAGKGRCFSRRLIRLERKKACGCRSGVLEV